MNLPRLVLLGMALSLPVLSAACGRDVPEGVDGGMDMTAINDSSSITDLAIGDLVPASDAITTFNCGMARCQRGGEFCYQVLAGRWNGDAGFLTGDGGAQPTPGCNPTPVVCQTSPTCSCYMASFDG